MRSPRTDVTVNTVEDAGCDECIGLRITGGFGAAVGLWGEAFTVFAFTQLLLRYAPGLDGMGGDSTARGPRTRWAITRDVALSLEGRIGPAGAEAQLGALFHF